MTQPMATWSSTSMPAAAAPRSALDHAVPQLIFLAIISSIPFYTYRQLPGPEFMKVDWILTALLLLIVLPYLVTQRSPPARLQSNLWGLLAVFLVANLAASLLSPYPEQATAGMITLLQAGLFLGIVMLMTNERTFEVSLPWAIALSMGLAAWLANLGFFFGVDQFAMSVGGDLEVRGAGATISANNMALMCVFALPLVVHRAVFAENGLARAFAAFLAVSIAMGVFSTVSRGGFLNLIVVLGLIALQYRGYFQIRYMGLAVAAVAVGLMLVVALVPADYFTRQATLVTEGTQDQSLGRRAAYVQVALRAFAERPLLGWGTDAFAEIWVRSSESRMFDMVKRPAHNTYLEVLVGTGIIGMAIWLLMLLRAYVNYCQAERALRELGDDKRAQLVAAYRIGLVALLFYFLIKSGIDHKYFLLVLPLSQAALAYADGRAAAMRGESTVAAGRTAP